MKKSEYYFNTIGTEACQGTKSKDLTPQKKKRSRGGGGAVSSCGCENSGRR